MVIRLRPGFVIAVVVALGLLAGCQGPAMAESQMQVVLQAVPDKQHPWPKSASAQRELMEQARKVILNRAKGSPGVNSADVTVQGDNKLLLTIVPAQKDRAKTIRYITSTAMLEFYWLKDIQNSNNPKGKWRMEAPATEERAYIFSGPHGVVIDSLKQPQEVLKRVVGVPKNKPVLTGKDLLPNARANINARSQIVISIQFNNNGTEIFRRFTAKHVGDYLAVFFDGKLLTAPTINDVIPGGKAEISGFRNLKQARDVAWYLNAGTLPVPFKVVAK
jgi:preprotein translocase subunit SecD